MTDTMRWVDQSFDSQAYVDASGKIVGRIKREYRRYAAWHGGPLGDFIDEPSAKQAVERAAKDEIHPFLASKP